ncbi:hypothetical protein N8482_02205 [Chitinophagales bacterium]|nr:hypothetical protein [Chitinophagales bacterium]
MNKITRLLLLLFLLLSVNSACAVLTAQDDSSEDQPEFDMEAMIRAAFAGFVHALEVEDFDAMLDLTSPRVFEFYPREKMKEALVAMASDELMTSSNHNFAIDEVSDLILVDDVLYADIHYHFTMDVKLKSLDDLSNGEESEIMEIGPFGSDGKELEKEDTKDLEEETNWDYFNLMQELLAEVYGEESVTADRENYSYVIQVRTKAIAIQEAGAENWTFIENKEQMNGLLSQIVPPEVLDRTKIKADPCEVCETLEDALVAPEGVIELMINPYSKGQNIQIVPAEIGLLENLEILYITEQSISDLPLEIAQLKNLRELGLAGCKFTELPEVVFELKQLDELILYDNPFTKEYIEELKKRVGKELPNTILLIDDDE